MTDDDSRDEAYLDHAVWLLEWHERRSEAFMTRAVGLLGFSGVLLAFLAQLVTRSDFGASPVGDLALGVALVSLAASAGFALSVLWGQRVEAPGVQQLRDWWSRDLESEGPKKLEESIIERFLVTTLPGKVSPLESAATAATTRSSRFKTATLLLFVGIVSMAVLLADVAVHA